MSDHGFERDLRLLRTQRRVAASIPSLQSTLRRDTVMDMDNETTGPEQPATRDLIRSIREAFDEVAAEHDITPAALLGEIVGNLTTLIAARRAARRGDVAKTVLYVGMAIRQNAAWYSRKTRLAVERAHAETMAAQKITLRTSVKGAV